MPINKVLGVQDAFLPNNPTFKAVTEINVSTTPRALTFNFRSSAPLWGSFVFQVDVKRTTKSLAN
uniref:Uncharacterized protein n=1 Tax=Romanomermis culicivorax TaxID=13658 RepID=A0A915JQD2_ROMCU